MAAHYCIGNPCWICYPAYAPKKEDTVRYDEWQSIIQDHYVPEQGISGVLKDIIINIFEYGLGEGQFYYDVGPKTLHHSPEMTIEQVKEERSKLNDASLEAILLDKLIAEYRDL